MKKIFLSLILVALACVANAQLYLSANVGGGMSSISTSTTTKISIQCDSTYGPTVVESPKVSSFVGGLKLGYKFGRVQVGISGSYNIYNQKGLPLDSSLMPTYEDVPSMKVTGNMDTRQDSYTIAPYVRVDAIKAGDIALFFELSGFYTATLNPKNTAHMTINVLGAAKSSDTTFRQISNATSWGVRITPGMSWQLSKHCGIDLYLDFLNLAYTVTTSHNETYTFEPVYDGPLFKGYKKTNTYNETEKSTYIGGALTGTPLLSDRNWVRVGFNFTF